MVKIFLAFLLFAFSISLQAQETDNISVTLNNSSLEEAISAIEKASGAKFYFDLEWLISENIAISQTFTNAKLTDVLAIVLEKTNLNYYVDFKKIILTKNRVIYDQLPENYFQGSQTATNSQLSPVFEQEQDSMQTLTEGKVALIGRESKDKSRTAFKLSGYVKNSKTKEPVPGVIVQIRGTKINAETDGNGFYQLNVPGGSHIIETISYTHKNAARKIVIYSDGKFDLNVTENVNQLDEVIVRSKEDQTVRTAITGVTSIDIEQIKNVPLVLGERDIMKVATTLPGIKVVGEGSSGYSVRGGKEDQNLILLDNAVLYNPSHFLGFFSAVNPFTTQKANIYKGSIPAEFGGRLSSVFDITTKNANHDRISGEGGVGPVTSNLAVGIPIVKGKAGLLIGGRATYSGWILRSLDEESLQNSSASFYDGLIKYDHRFNDKNDIQATIYYSHDGFSISSDSLYKYSNRLVSVGWNHTFNAKNKGSLVLTNSEYKFNIDYETTGTNSFDFGYKINETQLIAKAIYTLSEKHKITYGLAGKIYNIDPGYLDPSHPESLLVPVEIAKEKAFESAAHISDSYKVTDKLLVDVGLRYSVYASLGKSTQRLYESGVPISDGTVVGENTYDENEIIKTYGGLEPRVAMRYLITDDLSVKAGYDRTYQYVHLLSSNTTQSPTDAWKLSDLNVEPQVSDQFSVGLYQNLKNDTYELSIEGYFKKSNNILDYKVGSELFLNEHIETELLQGEGKAYGVEFLIKKNSGKLNGWLGYTYSRTFIKLDSEFNDERVNNGDYFPANFDKPHDFSAVLNYRLTKRYSISSNFVYQTGRPITYPVGSYQYGGIEYTLYSDRNKFRIPDYFRLDIGINIEGNHKIKKLAHSFWNISVYNVLGRNNPYSVFFVTESGEVKAYQSSIFSIPVPTITYNFKF